MGKASKALGRLKRIESFACEICIELVVTFYKGNMVQML